MESKTLQTTSNRGAFIDPVALQQMDGLAKQLITSGALPSSIKNAAQMMMVMMAGYEAGMTPMESINSYYIVNGKVTIWGDAVIRQLRRHGWQIEWVESTDVVATVKINDGKQTHEESYTIEDAKVSGLVGKGTWKQYPKEMLRHKAIGRAVRFTCPEVLGGFYLKEELDDVDAPVSITATDEQIKEIDLLIDEIGAERSDVEKWVRSLHNCNINQLTQVNATKIINGLKGRRDKKNEDEKNIVDVEVVEAAKPEQNEESADTGAWEDAKSNEVKI